ncbi:hypothetical protein PRBEI_2000942200 [Prionailurus iriomotensis]
MERELDDSWSASESITMGNIGRQLAMYECKLKRA